MHTARRIPLTLRPCAYMEEGMDMCVHFIYYAAMRWQMGDSAYSWRRVRAQYYKKGGKGYVGTGLRPRPSCRASSLELQYKLDLMAYSS